MRPALLLPALVCLLLSAAAWAGEDPEAAARGLRVRVPTAVRTDEAMDPAASAGLFVGVSDFLDGEGKPSESILGLPFAVDDAVDLAHLFSVELDLVPAGKLTLALSGEPRKEESRRRLSALLAAGARRTNAGYTNLLDLLSRLKTRAGENGILVVSFATHGFSSGEDFLLAQDSILTNPQRTSVRVQDLLDAVRNAPAGRRFILLDACRERLEAARSLGGDGGAASKSLHEALGAARGLVVLSGTTSGGFSYDDPELRNGVFTHHVLAGLRGAAAADDRGYITVRTLADYVDRQVKSWVAEHRPHHAEASTGISLQGEDLRASRMPLAIDPKQVPPDKGGTPPDPGPSGKDGAVPDPEPPEKPRIEDPPKESKLQPGTVWKGICGGSGPTRPRAVLLVVESRVGEEFTGRVVFPDEITGPLLDVAGQLEADLLTIHTSGEGQPEYTFNGQVSGGKIQGRWSKGSHGSDFELELDTGEAKAVEGGSLWTGTCFGRGPIRDTAIHLRVATRDGRKIQGRVEFPDDPRREAFDFSGQVLGRTLVLLSAGRRARRWLFHAEVDGDRISGRWHRLGPPGKFEVQRAR